MTLREVLSLVNAMLYGVAATLLFQWAYAQCFCWLRRRRAQRALDADRERRLQRVMTAIRQPAPPPEPLVKEARDDHEAYMIARRTICNLHAQDRRRWFPGDPTSEVN
jgi:hypothetical protein